MSTRRSYDRMYKEYDVKEYENKNEVEEKEEISLPEKKTEGEKKAYRHGQVIGGRSLNVRRQPKPDGEIVSTIKDGTKVVIVDESNTDWYKIDSPDGYVMKKFVQV